MYEALSVSREISGFIGLATSSEEEDADVMVFVVGCMVAWVVAVEFVRDWNC